MNQYEGEDGQRPQMHNLIGRQMSSPCRSCRKLGRGFRLSSGRDLRRRPRMLHRPQAWISWGYLIFSCRKKGHPSFLSEKGECDFSLSPRYACLPDNNFRLRSFARSYSHHFTKASTLGGMAYLVGVMALQFREKQSCIDVGNRLPRVWR